MLDAAENTPVPAVPPSSPSPTLQRGERAEEWASLRGVCERIFHTKKPSKFLKEFSQVSQLLL